MDALIRHLLDNLIIDFQGELDIDMVRDFLRNDQSPEAQALLAKLQRDRGTSEMMITLADCLKEYVQTGIHEDVVYEQLQLYTES